MDSLTKDDFLNGQTLLIDKPLNWTSFQAVNKLKWAIRKKFDLGKKFKIGHAGTLDPLATGLLIICTGKATKTIPAIQGQQKEYTGVITLGATTPSYDLESEIDQEFSTSHITAELIAETKQQFLGEIEQIPPIFSAVKKDGKRAYELARKGEEVQLNSRRITISAFEISTVQFPNLHFKVSCSKGTYIRSLAHDFGKALNSGAHLSALRRTKIGEFHVDNSVSPEDFTANL
ncbi:tRNA pseudouridine synthase B [Croceivirga lutea]|uniref:tRNA pseudouridine(55) synthase TruB n=1 Tax=Croceivirga lutea TaxID=1775167 RepID=UPI00163AF83C|nr:tRNA pseudouridine(55) synthase TruB [Croceivirga lutea]GGG36770.1 tRNA pseudouridine synthase B [Croceivirga lutea]